MSNTEVDDEVDRSVDGKEEMIGAGEAEVPGGPDQISSTSEQQDNEYIWLQNTLIWREMNKKKFLAFGPLTWSPEQGREGGSIMGKKFSLYFWMN